MSRQKAPPLTARNWDALVEQDADAIDMFGKVRHAVRDTDRSIERAKPLRPRQDFYRSRSF